MPPAKPPPKQCAQTDNLTVYTDILSLTVTKGLVTAIGTYLLECYLHFGLEELMQTEAMT